MVIMLSGDEKGMSRDDRPGEIPLMGWRWCPSAATPEAYRSKSSSIRKRDEKLPGWGEAEDDEVVLRLLEGWNIRGWRRDMLSVFFVRVAARGKVLRRVVVLDLELVERSLVDGAEVGRARWQARMAGWLLD